MYLRYFLLQLKKAYMVFFRSLAVMVIIGAFILIGTFTAGKLSGQRGGLSPLRITIVIPEEEFMTRLAVGMVVSDESAASICEFEYLDDEEDALEKGKKGLTDAVIIFPENFYMDIYNGVNSPVIVYLPESGRLPDRLFKELLTSGVSMLRTSQAGLYSLLSAGWQGERYGVEFDDSIGDPGEYVTFKYVSLILDRNKIYESRVLSPVGDYSFEEYYIRGGILLIILMSGLFFGNMYDTSSNAVDMKLKMYGIGVISTSLARIAAMFMVVLALALASLGASALFVPDILGEDSVVLCLGASAFASMYFHIMLGSPGRNASGVMLLFWSNMLILLLAGVFLPHAYLFPGSY